MAALTEEELLARALALSREEHAREQERRRMVAQQGEVVMSMRELEAQMQAAGLGYEVEYDEEAVDDDIPTVASTPSVAALAGQPVGGRSVQAPAYSPAAAAAASAFSSPNTHNNHVVSSLFATAPIPAPAPVPSAVMPPGLSLAPIGPPPSLRQQPSPMQPSPQPPARAPTLPGLEACFGGDDDDDADDDEPPTDLTCPIKFMLLVDPGMLRVYACVGEGGWMGRMRDGWR